MTNKHSDIPPLSIETISNGILVIRGQKVILDFSLAELYDVETKVLKQAADHLETDHGF